MGYPPGPAPLRFLGVSLPRLPRPPPPKSAGGPSVTQPTSHRAWSRSPKALLDSFCAGGVRDPGDAPAPPPAARNTDHTVEPGEPQGRPRNSALTASNGNAKKHLAPEQLRQAVSTHPHLQLKGINPRDTGKHRKQCAHYSHCSFAHTCAHTQPHPTVRVPHSGASGACHLLSACPWGRTAPHG